MPDRHRSLTLRVADSTVSARVTYPPKARACLLLAPGAGAGMDHSYLVALCDGLAAQRIATLRYQFPYLEKGSKRPDPPRLCHDTVRAAVTAAHTALPDLPLFAGGKSFGGRMTSQAQALAPLAGVLGIVFFGFPLHAPKQPTTLRADHLSSITIPMLFLQGTRDALAEVPLMHKVTGGLHSPVTLKIIEHADHSFHVPVRSGTTDADVMKGMTAYVSSWMGAVIESRIPL